MPRPPHFDWKGTAAGRRGLCHILLYAQGKAGDRLLSSSPGDFGVSGEEMRKYVLDAVLGLESEHWAATGQPLTARKMMGRLYNMFDVMPDGVTRKPSGEHPSRNEHLVGTWLVESGQQPDMFKEPLNSEPENSGLPTE